MPIVARRALLTARGLARLRLRGRARRMGLLARRCHARRRGPRRRGTRRRVAHRGAVATDTVEQPLDGAVARTAPLLRLLAHGLSRCLTGTIGLGSAGGRRRAGRAAAAWIHRTGARRRLRGARSGRWHGPLTGRARGAPADRVVASRRRRPAETWSALRRRSLRTRREASAARRHVLAPRTRAPAGHAATRGAPLEDAERDGTAGGSDRRRQRSPGG